MGPRSKHIKHELTSCDWCGCLFTNKDSNVHAGLCTETVPFEIKLEPVVNRGSSIDYRSCPHGFIVDHILVGNVEEIKAKDVPDHLPKSIQNRIIMMNPMTMKYLEMYIGKPVVIEAQEVFYAWPCSNVSLTSIRMIKAMIEELQFQQQKVTVQCLTNPDITAATVHCHIRNLEDLDIREKQLSDHLIRVSVGRYVTCGSRLHLDYYGRSCDVCISTVIGDDDSVQNAQAKSDVTTSLSESLDKLNLETGSPEASSTPCKLDKQNTKKCDIPEPRFYKISYCTKLVIDGENESDKLPISEAGPSLRDFGGFAPQIKLIKETMSIHLFRQQELAKQGLRSSGGLLLYGPSGGGKSMLINALAKEFSVYFVSISGAEIWSKYYGEAEAKLSSLIKEAENRAPSILFLDEVDVLCPKRESTKNEIEKRIVATLLTALDRLTNNRKRVFVLAATNKRQNVDGALRRPGRLDREIEIGVPSVNDRQEIIERLLWQTDHNISSAVIRHIAERAHGFLGADLAAVCKEATLHALKKESLSGKVILQYEDLCYGLQMVKPSAMKEVTLEVSKVSWSDIGGQEELKHKLRQAVEWPLKHPEAFARLGIRPPRGLLMYGPPGCSKTMIAKALAKESGLNFIAIKGPELFSKWVGESERAVREVFSKARAAAPAIVFFDEIDALAGERGSHSGGGGDVSDRVLAQLLTEMDGVQALEDILVVAATNRPDRIDKALMRPGRLDRIIYVPLPDAATRKAIFSLHFKKTPTACDVNIEELVKSTDGYSGAEVSAVCHEAALAALQEDINSTVVLNRHFSEALHIVKPRITAELIALYDKYNQVVKIK